MNSVVWLSARQGDLPRGEAWLTEAERAVLARLSVPKRRADWLLGRWAAKRALVVAGFAAREEDAAVVASASGAPEVFVLGRPAGATLSLTHSHGVAVAALGPGGMRLGVDLERIEERPAAFLADWFTESEQSFVALASSPALAATLVWCAKEAVMKALRVGLRIPAKSVEVTPEIGPADGEWRRYSASGPEGDAWRGSWRALEGFVLAVAADPPSKEPERLRP